MSQTKSPTSYTLHPTSNKGFTLIELLIVVAIISILISVGASSFITAQKQARNSQREADLGSVASALEQYYSDNNAYPQDSTDPDAGKIVCGAPISWGSNFTCSNKTYMSPLPKDPRSTQSYYYDALPTTCTGSECQQFVISAILENPNARQTEASSACSSQMPSGGYNYCVKNP